MKKKQMLGLIFGVWDLFGRILKMFGGFVGAIFGRCLRRC